VSSRFFASLCFCFCASVSLVSFFAEGLARAQSSAPPPAERRELYSDYERETLREILDERHAEQDPEPEGKIVERVDVVRLDVFEKRDVLPRWLNVFHMTTREAVVRKEVLLQPGEPFRQALLDDTIRNLRRAPLVPQLSAVLVVALRGSAPDRVVVLVVTKDVWSLRLNWSAVVDAGGLEQLELLPAETNFLGTHQVANLHFVLEPSAMTFGLGYTVPRLGTSRVALTSSANVMVNRQSGQAEGTYGSLVAGQPLYSGTTEWSWDAYVGWEDAVLRRYQNAQLAAYSDPSTQQKIPYQYRAHLYQATYELTRSFGWDVNHDFTLAANVYRAQYQHDFPGVDPKIAADFVRDRVPLSDTRVGPSLQYHTYAMRFVRVIDFDTLALQEDYRLGHDVVLRAYPSVRALGASRDVLQFYGAAQYTWAIRDGLVRASIQSTFDPEASRVADASVTPVLHAVTPTVAGLGRFVLDAAALLRWRNYLNQTSILGGDDRLRGYPTNFFVGQNMLSYNLEFRSRPVEILSCELGGVAFYDVGDAFKGFGGPYKGLDRFVPYQSVGVGMRALFPWLDRTVFRADIGLPIERPLDPATHDPIPPFSFLVSFGQAFATPTVAPTPVLPTGQGGDSP
jgi:hypothetical protein